MLTLEKILRAAELLDKAAVPMEHRRKYVSTPHDDYIECSCGIREYLDEDYDQP